MMAHQHTVTLQQRVTKACFSTCGAWDSRTQARASNAVSGTSVYCTTDFAVSGDRPLTPRGGVEMLTPYLACLHAIDGKCAGGRTLTFSATKPDVALHCIHVQFRLFSTYASFHSSVATRCSA